VISYNKTDLSQELLREHLKVKMLMNFTRELLKKAAFSTTKKA